MEIEQPSRIIYQWFSAVFIPKFDPTMITDREWLRANVYSASMGDTRTSKLNALCKVNAKENVKDAKPAEDAPLLRVEELGNGSSEGN